MRKHEGNKGMISELSRKDKNFQTLATLPIFILDWIDRNSNEVIVLINRVGEILFISQSAESILGYRKSELVGRVWQEMVALESIYPILKKFANKDKFEFVFDLDVRTKQNEFITFEASTAKVKDDLHNDFYYTSILSNVPQYKDIEEMMIQLEKKTQSQETN